MSDIITSSASAFPGNYAEVQKEKEELIKNLNEIVNAIPDIVSALPVGTTLAEVLTADPYTDSFSLFSTFWGNINLSDEQRTYINAISTDLFSKQKNARENTQSPCFVWPGDGNRYEQDRYITNYYGEKILAPRIWLFLSLSNCHGSFDSVGLVETYFLPWLIAIQKFILEHHFSKIDTSQEDISTDASTLLKMLSELETDIQDATILDSQKKNKIEELGTLIINLFTQFENMFLIHGKMEYAVSIDELFNKKISGRMFDNHKTLFYEQHKMFITIRDIINTQLKYPHSEIKFAFLASRPPSHNLLLRHNACRFNDEPDEPDEPDESSMMSID